MGIRIDGKQIAFELRQKIAEEVRSFSAEYGRVPCLAVVLVGDDPASQVYVRNKAKACEEAGMESRVIRMPKESTEDEVRSVLLGLVEDATVNGILLQLPLPKHLDSEQILKLIPATKDVDAFSMENVGKIMTGNYDMLPCTPAGIMELLRHENISPEGKHCVVIGRSNIVGKPMAMLLMHANGTVTICHSKTRDLKSFTRTADILVSSVGKPHFVTADMVKEGAVVIDVGMNRDENGKLCGDVEYDEVAPLTSAITPVPGGVGPMTIATLLQNTLTAAKKQNQTTH